MGIWSPRGSRTSPTPHIHPIADDRRAGTITFDAEFLTAGTYRLFQQFRAEGAVHTAPFTVDVE